MPPTKTPSKFSEQSKQFKFPAEIGHLTLFQDQDDSRLLLPPKIVLEVVDDFADSSLTN